MRRTHGSITIRNNRRTPAASVPVKQHFHSQNCLFHCQTETVCGLRFCCGSKKSFPRKNPNKYGKSGKNMFGTKNERIKKQCKENVRIV